MSSKAIILPVGYDIAQQKRSRVTKFAHWLQMQPAYIQEPILDKLAEAMSYAPASPNELQPPMCSRLLEEAKDLIAENGLEMETKS